MSDEQDDRVPCPWCLGSGGLLEACNGKYDRSTQATPVNGTTGKPGDHDPEGSLLFHLEKAALANPQLDELLRQARGEITSLRAKLAVLEEENGTLRIMLRGANQFIDDMGWNTAQPPPRA